MSLLRRVWWVSIMLGSGIYLLNPGFGIFELLPDSLPIVGNLDEMAFAILFIRSLLETGLIKKERISWLMNLLDDEVDK